jgi:hypothetical protein
MYMPRHGFADFLLYVSQEQNIVYVVPRGMIEHDTAWAEVGLNPYKEAWHLLKETSPLLFERKVESLSAQLRKIIAEADKHNLPYELIRSKRGEKKNDYKAFMQRRILIGGKRCAIFTATLLPYSTHPLRSFGPWCFPVRHIRRWMWIVDFFSLPVVLRRRQNVNGKPGTQQKGIAYKMAAD